MDFEELTRSSQRKGRIVRYQEVTTRHIAKNALLRELVGQGGFEDGEELVDPDTGDLSFVMDLTPLDAPYIMR